MGNAKEPGAKDKETSKNGEDQPFWKSIPGIITTVTGLIVAITTLVTLLVDNGIIGGKDPTETPTAVAVLPSDTPTLRPVTPTPSPTLDSVTSSPTITETLLLPTFTPTQTPTEPPSGFTPTATFYPGEPILVVLAGPGLNIRGGPGYDYPYGPAISTLAYGATVRILGITEARDWYLIECPAEVISETGCWVFGDPELVNAFVIVQLDTVPAPPTLTPLPTETLRPTVTSTPLG